MENKRPLILISNDDGYQAKGINSLVDMLRTLADIVVCAPDGPRSGFSCAFSAEIPLKLTLRRQEPGVEVWSCNGTPVDCVKMALDNIVSRRPDMVVGGINHGDNSSVNSHYSGTMGVVLEGCMKYIPSVAFSLCDHSEDADFEPMRPLVRSITQRVLKEGLPKGACLNVNFPDPSNLPCLGEAHDTPLKQGETERVVALLAGSRKQEIKDNLPAMIEATRHLADRYDIVLAGAPSIPPEYYEPFLKGSSVRLVVNETYRLLSEATAALVTSGTATLETCMFRVPQVVCYYTPLKRFIGFMRRMVLNVKYVSLVNLIADREVVTELVADTFSVDNIRHELEKILPGGPDRQCMLDDYEEVHRRLGESDAPDRASEIMIQLLTN